MQNKKKNLDVKFSSVGGTRRHLLTKNLIIFSFFFKSKTRCQKNKKIRRYTSFELNKNTSNIKLY
jgi:hypothetical protein